MDPAESQRIISLTPYDSNNLATVIPAAPAPLTIILHSFRSFYTTFAALIKPARVTMAVPC